MSDDDNNVIPLPNMTNTVRGEFDPVKLMAAIPLDPHPHPAHPQEERCKQIFAQHDGEFSRQGGLRGWIYTVPFQQVFACLAALKKAGFEVSGYPVRERKRSKRRNRTKGENK